MDLLRQCSFHLRVRAVYISYIGFGQVPLVDPEGRVLIISRPTNAILKPVSAPEIVIPIFLINRASVCAIWEFVNQFSAIFFQASAPRLSQLP